MTGPLRVDGLTVRFVDGPPTDEAIDAAHLCIGRARLTPPMTLRIRWAEPGVAIRSMRLVLAAVSIRLGRLRSRHLRRAAPGRYTSRWDGSGGPRASASRRRRPAYILKSLEEQGSS